jgi:hypothetical protein
VRCALRALRLCGNDERGNDPCDPTSAPAPPSPTPCRDHTTTVRKLSELQGDDPLVLTLARGDYRPKEHHEHVELAANFSKVAVAYAQSVTISTDDHHTTQEFRASSRGPVDLLVRSQSDDSEGPRYPEVHRPRARPDGPPQAGSQASDWWFTVSTGTGSGDVRRSTTYGATCAWCRARSAPIGT